MFTFGSEFESVRQQFIDQGGDFYTDEATYTVAIVKNRNGTFTVATAICNPNDEFNVGIGEALALERFANGKVITVTRKMFSAG